MDVKFNEPTYTPRTQTPVRATGLTRLLLSTGVVKNERQANIVLVALLLLIILVSYLLLRTTVAESTPDIPPADQQISMAV